MPPTIKEVRKPLTCPERENKTKPTTQIYSWEGSRLARSPNNATVLGLKRFKLSFKRLPKS